MTSPEGHGHPSSEEVLAAIAVTALENATPARLRALLDDEAPSQALARLASGAEIHGLSAELAARWREAARDDPPSRWRGWAQRLGVTATWLNGPGYPARLADDPSPPAVLLVQGGDGVAALDPPAAVGIVGTRQATGYGLDVARDLGRDLTAAGVTVVSGLALGIDGAAHEGALAGLGDGTRPEGLGLPVAVVGCGLDVIYPRRHRHLWDRLAAAGAVISESAPDAGADAWRFPLRNRIIAGLADVIVVVESGATGGSMHTVRAAIDRGRPVMAVPGSIRSPVSVGTNALLADGAAPVRDAGDVLTALALEGRRVMASLDDNGAGTAAMLPLPPTAAEPALTPDESAVLAAVDWSPTRTDRIAARVGGPLPEMLGVLARLEDRGLVRSGGGWWERAGTAR